MMSPGTDLWRRAPAWRYLLLSAVAATTLASVYTPWAWPGRALTDYVSASVMSLLRKEHNGLVIVANRAVPLPGGGWNTVVQMSQPSEPRVDSEVLAQVNGGRVTGLIMAQGTTTPSAAAGRLSYDSVCTAPEAYRKWIVAGAEDVHECWGIAPVTPIPGRLQPGSVFRTALEKLRSSGLELPPAMVAAGWYRQDATSTAAVIYFFDPAADPLTPRQPNAWNPLQVTADPYAMRFIQRVAEWSEHWTPMLERGAEGTLTQQEVIAALTSSDPNVFN